MPGPLFDLQSHSLLSDGELSPAQVVENAATAGVELLALSDHDTVDGVDEALAAGALHGVQGRARYRDLGGRRRLRGPSRARLRDRPPQLAARRAPARRARGPRAARRRHGREAERAGLRGRPRPDRGAQGGGQAGRPPAPGRRSARPPGQRGALGRRGPRGRLELHSRLPDSGHAGLRCAHATPPSRRRSAGSTTPPGVAIWAHPFWDIKSDEEVLAAIERYRAAGLDGVEVFYTSHTREQTLLLADRCTELGPAHHGVGRLPRARPPSLQRVPRLRGARARGEPRPDRPRHAGRARARRGRPVRLAHRPVGLGQVDHRAHRRGRAARPRAPRGGARRRRRAAEPVRRPRLLAPGPRHQRAPHRLGVEPAVAKRGGHLRGRRVTLPGRPRPGAGDDGRALRGGVRARLGRRVRAPRREGPLREGARGRDRGLHRASPTPTRSHGRPSC